MDNNGDIVYNPIYAHRADNCQDRFLFLFGGAGSGKSVFAVNKVVEWFLGNTKQRILIVRKTAKTLMQSVWEPIELLLKRLGVWSDLSINRTNKTITDKISGNQILFLGMDDPEKLKSIFGITKVWIEEVSELDEPDFLQIDLRLRGSVDDYFQILACFNPVNKEHWLVKHVEPQMLETMPQHMADLEYINEERSVWRFAQVDSETGAKIYTTVLNTNYKHNIYIDAQYITRLRNMASIDVNYYQVYERGRWGEVNAGDRYCPAFMESVHVHKLDYVPQQPIHYTLDFNVKPYMSGLCIQLIYNNNEYQVRVFKQFALQHPENTAYHLGANFIANFQEIINFGVYLYGDASGNNSLGVKDTKSLFADVKNGFGYYASLVEDRIPTSNPRYAKIAPGALGRRTFLNACFANNGTIPIRVLIDPSCTELISDLRLCTQDANGKLAKPKKNGIEERGHMLQALEYFICHKESLGELAIL